MPVAQKGQRFGGRAKGTRNKSTIEREVRAEAARLAAIEAARRAQNAGTLVLATADLMRAAKIAEGFAVAFQPKITRDEATSKVTIAGGDVEQCGKWFDRWASTLKELAKYQTPAMKAVDAPTPPPDPNQSQPVRTMTLRIFEGGRQIKGPPMPSADE